MRISQKCSIAIHCLIFIYEYGSEKKVTSNLLALSTGCNPVTIRKILSALKKSDIITVLSGTGGASMSASPKNITLYEICNAVEPEAINNFMGIHASPSPLCPVGKSIKPILNSTYKKLQSDLTDSLKSITLQDILNDYHTFNSINHTGNEL